MDASGQSEQTDVLIRSFGDRLINHRLKLKQRLLADLGDITEWTGLAGQLVGLALLNQLDVNHLLDSYLEQRLSKISETLESTTLIGIIGQIKDTAEAMDKVFGSGQGLYLCFKTVTTSGWCPGKSFGIFVGF